MKKVKAISRLARDNPHGCNVGIIIKMGRGASCGFNYIFVTMCYGFHFKKKVAKYLAFIKIKRNLEHYMVWEENP